MNKPVIIKFIDDKTENEYMKLNRNDSLRKRIDRTIRTLKENPTFGEPIPKRLIPNRYLDKGIDNAFWVKLNKEQRLIYSLSSEGKSLIVAIIIDWFFDHKTYERRFKY